MLRLSPTVRTRFDTPANTLPVNWRRWVTQTWRTIRTASRGGWKQGSRWRRVLSAHTNPSAATIWCTTGIGSKSNGGDTRGKSLPCRTCSTNGRRCTTTRHPFGAPAAQGAADARIRRTCVLLFLYVSIHDNRRFFTNSRHGRYYDPALNSNVWGVAPATAALSL